jgi:hypothetical protein
MTRRRLSAVGLLLVLSVLTIVVLLLAGYYWLAAYVLETSR